MSYLRLVLATALCYTLVPTTAANSANCTTGVTRVIPYKCAPNEDMIENLCYPKCSAGYHRVGAVCRQNCPNGFRDMGYYCRIDPRRYGRGAGYPWKFGDWFSDQGMRSRCERDHGANSCEKWGLVYYPKCKPGYTSDGCCICRATKIDCNALGLDSNIFGYSCKMKVEATSKIGVKPSSCELDEQLVEGFCHKKC